MSARQTSDALPDDDQPKDAESDLRNLSRSLEQRVRLLETTLSHITDFAYVFDSEGRFIYVNQALLDLSGLRLDEAFGKNFFDLKYPADLATKLQQQIQQVFDTGQGLTDETAYTLRRDRGDQTKRNLTRHAPQTRPMILTRPRVEAKARSKNRRDDVARRAFFSCTK